MVNVKQLEVLPKHQKWPLANFEKSPVRTPPVAEQHTTVPLELSSPMPSRTQSVRARPSTRESGDVDNSEASKRLPDVVAFLTGLGKSVLES